MPVIWCVPAKTVVGSDGARHRLSKLLLRQGIGYYGGNAWAMVHDTWLRRQSFEFRRTRVAPDVRHHARRGRTARPPRRGDHPNGRDECLHPGGVPARLPARGRGADRVRAGGGDRRLAAAHRTLDRRLLGAGAHGTLLGQVPLTGIDHQDRKRPRTTTCSRPPGTAAGPTAPSARHVLWINRAASTSERHGRRVTVRSWKIPTTYRGRVTLSSVIVFSERRSIAV
jgi:hypothetical protein